MMELKQQTLLVGKKLDKAKVWFPDDGVVDSHEEMARMVQEAQARLRNVRTKNADWDCHVTVSDQSLGLGIILENIPLSPSHVKVEGAPYSLANGIFTKLPEVDNNGFPVWQKWGTAFCIRWHDPLHPCSLSAAPSARATLVSMAPIMFSSPFASKYVSPIPSATPSAAPSRGGSLAPSRGGSRGGSLLPSRNPSRVPSKAGDADADHALSHQLSKAFARQLSPVPFAPSRQGSNDSLDSDSSGGHAMDADESFWQDWTGWLLCTIGVDRIVLARMGQKNYYESMGTSSRRSSEGSEIYDLNQYDPGSIAWEAWDAKKEGANCDDICVTSLSEAISVVHIFHGSSGHLGGTCHISDDINGRTSYRREDGVLTISWDCNEQRWLMEATVGTSAQPRAKQKDYLDDLDPISVPMWQLWDENTQDYDILDERVSVLPGPAPEMQVYVTSCFISDLNGVYNLCDELRHRRPEYTKISKQGTYFIHWDTEIGAFTLDYINAENQVIYAGRSTDAQQLPTEAKKLG